MNLPVAFAARDLQRTPPENRNASRCCTEQCMPGKKKNTSQNALYCSFLPQSNPVEKPRMFSYLNDCFCRGCSLRYGPLSVDFRVLGYLAALSRVQGPKCYRRALGTRDHSAYPILDLNYPSYLGTGYTAEGSGFKAYGFLLGSGLNPKPRV